MTLLETRRLGQSNLMLTGVGIGTAPHRLDSGLEKQMRTQLMSIARDHHKTLVELAIAWVLR